MLLIYVIYVNVFFYNYYCVQLYVDAVNTKYSKKSSTAWKLHLNNEVEFPSGTEIIIISRHTKKSNHGARMSRRKDIDERARKRRGGGY